ncbi:MAG: hypothetical protein LBF97_04925 [Elusimicrobiota bacterium]|jgi:hypothetical protein|nr:hypothetical protein [Elusimicrobiota bacterium]
MNIKLKLDEGTITFLQRLSIKKLQELYELKRIAVVFHGGKASNIIKEIDDKIGSKNGNM